MKEWTKPALHQFGSVEAITLNGEVKLKTLGNVDDFGIVGVTNPKVQPG